MLQYFPKIGGRKKNCQNPIFMTKKNENIKVLWPLSPRGGGGGKAFMARPLREEMFFADSLSHLFNSRGFYGFMPQNRDETTMLHK